MSDSINPSEPDKSNEREWEVARKARMAREFLEAQAMRSPIGSEGREKSWKSAIATLRVEMAAKDRASGAKEKRQQPMREALAEALELGGADRWETAMFELAQVALDEARPLSYAIGLCDLLTKEEPSIPPAGWVALARHLEQERRLAAPGMDWHFNPGEKHLERLWEQALQMLAERERLAPPPAPWKPKR